MGRCGLPRYEPGLIPRPVGPCKLTLISVPLARANISIRNISNTSNSTGNTRRTARAVAASVLIGALLASGCAQSGGFSVAVQDLQAQERLTADGIAIDGAQAYPTSVFVPLPHEGNAPGRTTELASSAFEQALMMAPTPLPTSVPPVRPSLTDASGDTATAASGDTATAVPDPTIAPTAIAPTPVPATAVPPTAVPATAVPATAVPPTAVPATPTPSTAVPPTPVPSESSGVGGAEVALSAATENNRTVGEQTHAPFAAIGSLTLYLPSMRVEHVGFHQAVNAGAQQMTAIDSPVPATQLASRGRGTGSHTAADIVVEPGATIVSPVSGTVLAANTYVLYCEYDDSIIVIEPDGLPGWETKLLHISGVQVSVGQRVEAGVTVIASGPTVFPFESQVDDFTSEPAWPHVHIETVDTSIPHEGSTGSCP